MRWLRFAALAVILVHLVPDGNAAAIPTSLVRLSPNAARLAPGVLARAGTAGSAAGFKKYGGMFAKKLLAIGSVTATYCGFSLLFEWAIPEINEETAAVLGLVLPAVLTLLLILAGVLVYKCIRKRFSKTDSNNHRSNDSTPDRPMELKEVRKPAFVVGPY